jgi:flagellum-specific peptidoglycan hydrolase FlgJ
MVADKLTKLAYKNGYHVVSPIIAQSILESGWGSSTLAEYYNFFGMKANERWKGDYVEMTTQEEKDGQRYTVKAKFRKYKSFAEGLQGYFDFIAIPRYDALRVADDYEEYCDQLKICGYATSSKYPDNLKRIIEQYKLYVYDAVIKILEK